ncbi:MAG TPA: type II CAAX endopeptidase family protein [Candidatus Acidoferrales bacterium]|nr:type II CAAX endopeptidase family protein [Candidatus Acidoferrales bacterium]
MFLGALLAAILGLLCERPRAAMRAAFKQRPWIVWALPLLLTGYFLLASLTEGQANPSLIAIVLAYTAAPVACAYFGGPDFLTILLLWLPLEFPAPAAKLIARHAQGFLHSVAYGIAILLGLALFAGFRGMQGMKYNLPRSWRDLRLPLVGFAVTAPVLAVVGTAIGFIPPPHWPAAGAGRMASAMAIIFAGTALPEEILFRSMIQNLLMQRFGATARTLFVSALIFGAAHLDNGPQPLPNWRYMILATIAGFAYGKVFQKSSTVLASALFHMLVDWTRHFFF